jgi:hypothetical protein
MAGAFRLLMKLLTAKNPAVAATRAISAARVHVSRGRVDARDEGASAAGWTSQRSARATSCAD